MKKFGKRLGLPTNDVMDARDLLKAKRNINNNVLQVRSDARDILVKRNVSKPKLDFTIPIKTISNDNFVKQRPESGNFSIRKPNDLTLKTNHTAGRAFSNPKISQGIFSRSMTPGGSTDKRMDLPSSNAMRPLIAPKRNSAELNDRHFDYNKRPRVDELEGVKFRVVNNDAVPPSYARPPLTTARMSSHKSLISPIQGYRIEVKNLHNVVTVDDVYELFTSLRGDLRSCNLVRPGYAEVVFRTLADAEMAIREFHGRELDHRPMDLKLVTPALEPSTPISNSDIMAKIAKIQSTRKLTPSIGIDKDAIYRSMYIKSADQDNRTRKPFKFAVTL